MKRLAWMTLAASSLLTAGSVVAAPIDTVTEAIAYAMARDEVPATDTMRLRSVIEKNIRKGQLVWSLSFRDGDQITTVEVNNQGRFKLLGQVEKDQINPEFWANRPIPADMKPPTALIEKTHALITAFNPDFKPVPDLYIATYTVCKPRKPPLSEGERDCVHRTPLELVVIYLKVMLPDGEWTVKGVSFNDGSPDALMGATKHYFR